MTGSIGGSLLEGRKVAVVIPCYRVREHVADVIRKVGPWASGVYCVDDACPDKSGEYIAQQFAGESHVHVIFREENGGVGAATITGYEAARADGADILVKVDGDGQMDPRLIPRLVQPLLKGEADYAKANRFFSRKTIAPMPMLRIIGNAGLSFMTKASTGYWGLFDATNGFTAIHASIAAELPFESVHKRYFFESDLLFQLSILRARVVEVPMVAHYGDERSNLSELNALLTFPIYHARNFCKRILYNYFLRNFSPASLMLVSGLFLLAFGVVFGGLRWYESSIEGQVATAGTVMLATLPTLIGFQLLLSFFLYDISTTPNVALHPRIEIVRPMRVGDSEGGDVEPFV